MSSSELRSPTSTTGFSPVAGPPGATSSAAWAARISGWNASRWVLTKRNTPLPLTQASVEVQPRAPERTIAAGTGPLLVPVQVLNRGNLAIAAEGPARFVLRCQVQDQVGPATTADRTGTVAKVIIKAGLDAPVAGPEMTTQTGRRTARGPDVPSPRPRQRGLTGRNPRSDRC